MQIQPLCGGGRLGNKMLSNVILYLLYIEYTHALLYYIFYVIMQIHILCKLCTENPEIRLYEQLTGSPRIILFLFAVRLEHSPRIPTSL